MKQVYEIYVVDEELMKMHWWLS